jgi:hypothetical protein
MSDTIYHKKSGMTFDKTLIIDNNKYQLISLGTRTKFNFVFYGIGLYSDNPISEKNFDTDDKQILVIQIYFAFVLKDVYTALAAVVRDTWSCDTCDEAVTVYARLEEAEFAMDDSSDSGGEDETSPVPDLNSELQAVKPMIFSVLLSFVHSSSFDATLDTHVTARNLLESLTEFDNAAMRLEAELAAELASATAQQTKQ